jgi:hypothetical protein
MLHCSTLLQKKIGFARKKTGPFVCAAAERSEHSLSSEKPVGGWQGGEHSKQASTPHTTTLALALALLKHGHSRAVREQQ